MCWDRKHDVRAYVCVCVERGRGGGRVYVYNIYDAKVEMEQLLSTYNH